MQFTKATLVVAAFAVHTVLGAASKAPFANPKSGGGSMLTSTGQKGGEPLNVIISGASDPAVLSKDGFASWTESIKFKPNDCLQAQNTDPSLEGVQKANLGDGNGMVPQAGLMREHDACSEVFTGGNHFRYWFQNGKKANTGSVFLAASVEKPIREHHDIVKNGYDLGRDHLVANATGGTTTDSDGNQYQTRVSYDQTLLKGIKTSEINHNIGINGSVAILTVKRTKTGSKSNNSAASLRAFSPQHASLLVLVAVVIITPLLL